MYLFAFGSGGISPYRDSLFVLSNTPDDKNYKVSLSSLYAEIKAKALLKNNELNIEGAALAGQKLLLFNRGKNLIFLFNWNDFVKYIWNQNSSFVPSFKILQISLPMINGLSCSSRKSW